MGGYFDIPEAEGSDECAQLQAESTTGTLYIPLTRGETNAYTQTMKLETVPKTRKVQEISVEWADGETNKTVEIADFGASWYEADKNVLLTLLDDEGNSAAETVVSCVEAQENSVDNPYWLGEEFDFGDWTMDLDAAKAKVAAADGDAYTLVTSMGSLWCHDCANTARNFLGVEEGGENKFQAWAKSKNVALVAADIPNYTNATDYASPCLLSRTPYESTLAYESPGWGIYDISQGGAPEELAIPTLRSGLGYLSRKGVSDEAASAQLEVFHQLLAKNTSEGGIHRPEDVSHPYRTGVPIFTLLDKSGKVVVQFTRFSSKSALTADVTKFDDIIARFDEMLAMTSAEHAEDIENNFPSAASAELDANGGVAEGELSCSDYVDTFLLKGVDGGVLQNVAITGAADARVIASFVMLDGKGAAVNVGNSVTNSLSQGIALEYEFAGKGTYYVKIEAADTGAGYFAYDSKKSTFAQYELATSMVLVPQESMNTVEIKDGQTNVVFRLENGQLYRMQGIVADGESLVLEEQLGGKPYYRAHVDGDVTVDVENGSITVSYQKWMPGTIGFELAEDSAKESDGDITVNLIRTGGSSGKTKVRVSLDVENTNLDDSDGKPRYGEFNPVEFEWTDGDSSTNSVKIALVYNGVRYDGDGQVALSVERLEGVADIGITNFILNVSEVDTPNPGTIEFTGADPFFSKADTVYVKAGETATLYATRTTNACDSAVAVTVTTTKGTLESAEVAWENHKGGDAEVKLGGLNKGETATVTISNPTNGAKLGKKKSLKVLAVDANGPEFATPENSLSLNRYVVTSNIFQLVDAPAGKVTFTKITGTLPSGLKATYDAAANALAIWGVPSKAGEFEVVYQAKDGTAAGLTTKIAFSISDPTDAKNNPGYANASTAKSRTFFDLMAIDSDAKRLVGTLKLTIPAKGNLSGKLVCADGTISFSAKNWSEFDVGTKALTAELAAKSGYAATVLVEDGGAVAVEITKNGELFAMAATDGSVWNKGDSTPWKGVYNVILPNAGIVSEGTEGIAPTGTAFIRITSVGNDGKIKWEGMLPNGTSVKESTGTVMTRGEGCAYLPVFKSSKTDLFSGVLKITENAVTNKIRQCIVAYDEAMFVWKHTEQKTETACWEVSLGAFGSYYDAKNDDLVCACEEAYSGAQELGFYALIENNQEKLQNVSVTETSIGLTKDQENPYAVKFKFTRSTGYVDGEFYVNGVKCTYKGLILIGWGGGLDCGCSEVDPSLLQPFVGGYYTYDYNLPYKNGTRDAKLKLKLGSAVKLDAK